MTIKNSSVMMWLVLALLGNQSVLGQEGPAQKTQSSQNNYVRRDLVVNKPEYATPDIQIIDPLLVNP